MEADEDTPVIPDLFVVHILLYAKIFSYFIQILWMKIATKIIISQAEVSDCK